MLSCTHNCNHCILAPDNTLTGEGATYLCTNSPTVDCHCAVRPFRGIPPLVSSTGHTASRSCQATTNSRLVSIFQTAVMLNRRFVRKQRKADSCRVKMSLPTSSQKTHSYIEPCLIYQDRAHTLHECVCVTYSDLYSYVVGSHYNKNLFNWHIIIRHTQC